MPSAVLLCPDRRRCRLCGLGSCTIGAAASRRRTIARPAWQLVCGPESLHPHPAGWRRQCDWLLLPQHPWPATSCSHRHRRRRGGRRDDFFSTNQPIATEEADAAIRRSHQQRLSATQTDHHLSVSTDNDAQKLSHPAARRRRLSLFSCGALHPSTILRCGPFFSDTLNGVAVRQRRPQ